MSGTKAVFLDRDGVINKVLAGIDHWIRSPQTLDEFEILPGVEDAIKLFKEMGFKVIVFSNQPDIARKRIDMGVLEQIGTKMKSLGVDAVYCCPHHPSVSECGCRKPKPGLILRARDELNIDLGRSVAIGDNLSDLMAADAVGFKILIGTWRCDLCKFMQENNVNPDFIAKDLLDAANKIKGFVGEKNG